MPKTRAVTVSVQGAVSLPSDRVMPLCEEILQALREQPGRVSLSVDLSRDLEAPVEASLSVPVALQVARTPREHEFSVWISAAKRAAFYPGFKGTLRITPARNDSSVVTLKGAYVVPLGAVGQTIDMTLLRGAARSSLRRFLDEVLEGIVERVHVPA